MALIACQNVSLAYEGRRVISDLTFEVEKNDYLCIVGENGAGKSTLIKGMLSLLPLESGTVVLGEGLKKNEIGYLPQQSSAQREFPASVYEVVLSGCLNRLGGRPFYGRADKKRVAEKMELMGITDLAKCSYRELSGGQQQRVMLARALCATSKVLVMDEPVTGLDPKMTIEFYRLVEQLNRQEEIAVVMVSHDVRTAADYAKHILHLGREERFFGTRDAYVGSSLGKYFLEKPKQEVCS